MLKEVRVNGVDATDRPLPFGRPNQSLTGVEVVLTDRVSELAGTVTDDRGAPARDARVVAFSSDRGRWYPGSRFHRATASDADGAFTIAGLPFGNYYVAALSQLPPGGDDGWQDPQVLETLARTASSVTVRDGEKQVVTLRVSGR